jgi:hydrogenase large subunit
MYMSDHYIHFYVLSALDYLDILAVTQYTGNDPGLVAIKDKITALAAKGDTSPFTPRYTPDEYCISDPEIVTTLVSHYIKAIELKAKSMQMMAHITGLQPHPNSINAGGCFATPSVERLRAYKTLLQEQVDFVNNVYFPDVKYVGTEPLCHWLQWAWAAVSRTIWPSRSYRKMTLPTTATVLSAAGILSSRAELSPAEH